MSKTDNPAPLNPLFLEILRCPVAVRDKTHSPDPGRLRLVRGCWLVCDESGMKYPIRDGIPIMMIEEGEKWRGVAEEALPVPPPPG
ncbi:Trm112 family protein [Promineifilum sp.]|uniref:Trm112 family protein n=1 Tax=Promineifilum sp. TaxID=2664178 RepID=UPI0035B497C8